MAEKQNPKQTTLEDGLVLIFFTQVSTASARPKAVPLPSVSRRPKPFLSYQQRAVRATGS